MKLRVAKVLLRGVPSRGTPAVVFVLWAGVFGFAAAAHARVVQFPEGGAPARIVDQGVLCGPVAPGWSLEGDGRSVQPPRRIPAGSSRQFSLRVASSVSGCSKSENTITLVATGVWPAVDPAGVIFHPGEGRLELRGRGLKGVQVAWPRVTEDAGTKDVQAKDGQAKDDQDRWAVESCLEPTVTPGKVEVCTIPVGRDLGAIPDIYWLPAHANVAEDAILYDELGNRVARDRFRLRPTRVVLPARLHTKDGVDVSRGPGFVPLLYSGVVAAVDCGLARCELADKGVLVRSVPGPATTVAMRLRLAPRMFVTTEKGELATEVSVKLPLLSCPVSVASGPILRDVSKPRIVIRMDPGCGAEAGGMSWAVAGEDAQVQRVVQTEEGVFVLLATERIMRDKVTITAARSGVDAVVVASTTEMTIPVPTPRASLELEEHGKINFIPINRDALVTVATAGEKARFVLVPVAGAYHVGSSSHAGVVTVRGDENAGGFASLHFAYRMPTLPSELAGTDLAVVTEPVQRLVRQASVPAPFGVVGGEDGKPLVEFLCADKAGKIRHVSPGTPYRVPYAARDTCRLVIHRENLREEDGLQEVVLEVEVTRADGSPRLGAMVRERMVLRPGADPKVFWIRGGVDQFDRIVVRLTHVVDEERYVLSPTTRAGLPSAQWSAVIEGGRLRLYATAAIPAGLFRVNEPSGELRLNFGVLSRLTWLNDLGQEGLLGLEVGVAGLGLVASRGLLQYPPTLGAVAGLGVRVPLGSGAAVGVHAWVAYEFREDFTYGDDDKTAGKVAFIFGPSISIGNVGTNL